MIVIEILLGIAAAVAGVGYTICALHPFGNREAMAPLLIAFILALGFLGLLLK